MISSVAEYDSLMGLGSTAVDTPEDQLKTLPAELQGHLKRFGWDELNDSQKQKVIGAYYIIGINRNYAVIEELFRQLGPNQKDGFTNPYSRGEGVPGPNGRPIGVPPPERAWYEKLWNNINQKEVWWVLGGVVVIGGTTYMIMRK